MIRDKIINFGIKMIKKGLSDSSELDLNSQNIRTRYHRIRKHSYQNFELEKPILMVGVPHSGTSVLASTFRIHPDIAMWTEASEVWEPSWEEGMDSDYDRLIPKHEEDVEIMDVLRIRDAFGRFVKSQNKKRLLNKNPRNTVRIKFMKKIFPDSKIIHIFRDGREVVNSITRNMQDSMIEEICDRWLNSIKEIKNQTKNIPPNDFYEIKYEDFCERPKEIIIEAYQKCELPITDKICNSLPIKLHNFNGKWREKMNEKYHGILRKKLESTMNQLGYDWNS